MSVLMVPDDGSHAWPTLGPQVCRWIERNLVFGPGDLRGQPARLDDEKRALIYRMYEVYPQGHDREGRRRFKRCAVSLRKGSAKTELAAWLVAVELHKAGPVRCVGWTKKGQPIGGPVRDPFIPIVAYTEEQSEELCYGALLVILRESKAITRDFDLGLERIMRVTGDGKAQAFATAPGARDGARTTFQVFDETHHFSLPRLKKAHQTMLANIPKRRLSDAWSLETTTAPAPGEGSVAEATMEYAKAVDDGRLKDSRLFFFHRQAGDGHDLETEDGVRAAVMEASGPVAEWSDIESIMEQWRDPTADRAYLERVWLNRLVRASDRAFDAEQWKELAKPGYVVPDGALITLGFDGARYRDAVAIIGTEVATGHQFVIGLWEKPPNVERWEAPEEEVNAVMDAAFTRWNVWRAYCDPPYWESTCARWAGKYGEERVIFWYMSRKQKAAFMVRAYANAIASADLTHDGAQAMARHIGNAYKRFLTTVDEQGEKLWFIGKERADSPNKIDGAASGALSWEARRDAIAAGATKKADVPRISILGEMQQEQPKERTFDEEQQAREEAWLSD